MRANLPSHLEHLVLHAYGPEHATAAAQMESAVQPVSPSTLDYQLNLAARRRTEVALDGDRAVGFVDVRPTDDTRVVMRLAVDPTERGHGLGTFLFERATDFARISPSGASVRTRVHEEDSVSLEWAAHRGFEQFAQRISMARDLARDAEDLERAAEQAATSVDVQVVGWPSSSFADDWTALESLVARCLSATMDTAAGGRVPDSFARMVVSRPQGALLALRAGVPLGISSIAPGPDSVWNTWFTGVVPEARGEGVARALKLATLAVASRDGGRRITTFNDVKNAPIISLNESLGFERRPGVRLLEARLDEDD